MNTEQALSIIRQVAEAFVGNLKDHQQIQDAIKFVENKLDDKPHVRTPK